MMHGAFRRVLERYGQKVVLHYGVDGVAIESRGFLEPILSRDERWEQQVPTPLGIVNQDRFLYLGEPEKALDTIGDGYILCQQKKFSVHSAQAVFVGEEVSHWCATLGRVEEGVAP